MIKPVLDAIKSCFHVTGELIHRIGEIVHGMGKILYRV